MCIEKSLSKKSNEMESQDFSLREVNKKMCVGGGGRILCKVNRLEGTEDNKL